MDFLRRFFIETLDAGEFRNVNEGEFLDRAKAF